MLSIIKKRSDDQSDARNQVEAYCQSLVDSGIAQWQTNEDGVRVELHLNNGEAYLFGQVGVTRLS